MKKKFKGRKHPEMLPARNWHPSTLGPMVGYELRIQVTFTLYEQRRRPLNNGCQIPRNKNGECLLFFVPTLEDFPQAIWHSPNLNSMSPPGLQLSFRKSSFLPMHFSNKQRACQSFPLDGKSDLYTFPEARPLVRIRPMYLNQIGRASCRERV